MQTVAMGNRSTRAPMWDGARPCAFRNTGRKGKNAARPPLSVRYTSLAGHMLVGGDDPPLGVTDMGGGDGPCLGLVLGVGQI